MYHVCIYIYIYIYIYVWPLGDLLGGAHVREAVRHNLGGTEGLKRDLWKTKCFVFLTFLRFLHSRTRIRIKNVLFSTK